MKAAKSPRRRIAGRKAKVEVGKANGHDVTLEDVFMELTGKKLRVEEEK
jgi:hypothetical protein